MRVAIVGSGIAGLGCAQAPAPARLRVTVFEANDYAGGHTHTVDVTLDGVTAPVDTGFLVYNDRTYPQLIALFAELGIDIGAKHDELCGARRRRGLEWAGTDLCLAFRTAHAISRGPRSGACSPRSCVSIATTHGAAAQQSRVPGR